MNTLKFSCPPCGQHLEADEEQQGTQIQCPTCHATIAVPTLPARQTRPTTASPAAIPHSSKDGAVLAKTQIPTAAWASLVLSIASLVIGPLGFIPGIVCGHIARGRIRRDPRLGGESLATAGLLIGYGFVGLTIALMAVVGSLVFKTAQRVQQQTQSALRTASPTASATMPPPLSATMDRGSGIADEGWKTNLSGIGKTTGPDLNN
jgi:DNA-directed RNA polymerase subunit RPC12/RpoP